MVSFMSLTKKIRATLLSVGVAAAMLGGTVAIAQPAQAYTITSCYNTNGTPYTGYQATMATGSWRYINYSWLEELWHYQDGWYFTQGRFC